MSHPLPFEVRYYCDLCAHCEKLWFGFLLSLQLRNHLLPSLPNVLARLAGAGWMRWMVKFFAAQAGGFHAPNNTMHLQPNLSYVIDAAYDMVLTSSV